jgi:hypothetical protein
MSEEGDCGRVREATGIGKQCCPHCHERGPLTGFLVEGLGRVRVCCNLSAPLLLHGPDVLPISEPWMGRPPERPGQFVRLGLTASALLARSAQLLARSDQLLPGCLPQNSAPLVQACVSPLTSP